MRIPSRKEDRDSEAAVTDGLDHCVAALPALTVAHAAYDHSGRDGCVQSRAFTRPVAAAHQLFASHQAVGSEPDSISVADQGVEQRVDQGVEQGVDQRVDQGVRDLDPIKISDRSIGGQRTIFASRRRLSRLKLNTMRDTMRKTTRTAMLCVLAMLSQARGAQAQRQPAAPVTDTTDPRFITAQTRKQGGPMPAEQMALVFDHLDHALKVFPGEKRIEGVTSLRFTTSAPIRTLVLDFYPRYSIASISIDGKVVSPTTYSNPDGDRKSVV